MRSQGKAGLGYEDRGSGAAVVLLHPFPFSRDIWSAFADTLAVRRRVIAVDAPGFGESPLAGPYAIADLADELAALLTELGIGRAALLGMSMGGYTALAFAAKHPKRLAALVLADTRAAADTDATRAARDAAIELVRSRGPGAYLAASLGRLLSPAAPPELQAELRARAETRAPSLIAGLEALRDRPDRSRELGAVSCPTLVVYGDGDQVVPVDEMRGMADAIPGARFSSIPGAGHLAHLEAPVPFGRAVEPFLAAVDRRDASAAEQARP